MAQPKHYESGGFPFFVESNCFERSTPFRNPVWARFFIWELGLLSSRDEVLLHAFVLMPDHFHLLLTLNQDNNEANISKVVKSLKGRSARGLNFIFEREGNLWQKGFHDRIIRVEKSIRRAIEYIHNNPVEAGLVKNPGDWPFSSYWAYADENRFKLPVRIVKPVLV